MGLAGSGIHLQDLSLPWGKMVPSWNRWIDNSPTHTHPRLTEAYVRHEGLYTEKKNRIVHDSSPHPVYAHNTVCCFSVLRWKYIFLVFVSLRVQCETQYEIVVISLLPRNFLLFCSFFASLFFEIFTLDFPLFIAFLLPQIAFAYLDPFPEGGGG
jgi:hypothetical protein